MRIAIFLLINLLFFQEVFAQKFQDTIPFRDDLGIIIIPISFNNKVKHFAFDTGAQRTISYKWASEELKATKKQLTVLSSSRKKSKMRFYKSGKIQLGSRKISGHKILNTSKNEIFSCYEVDGILGVDIIQEFNWKINFDKKYLIMYPSNYTPDEVNKMHKLDFMYSKSRPYVFLKTKSTKFKFLLDTGASGYANISKRNYNLTGLEKIPQQELYTGSYDVNGIFSPSSPLILKFPKTKSKEVLIKPIVFYNNVKSSKIGNRVWENKSLFLDLKDENLFVSSQEINNSYESFPCSFAYKNGKIVVAKIHKNTKVWQLGLRQGVEVKEINGREFYNFCSLDKYQRSLTNYTKPIEITLINGKRLKLYSKNYFE